jgi:hypothetical protein
MKDSNAAWAAASRLQLASATVYCTVQCCSSLSCVILHFTVLHSTAPHFTVLVLPCTAMYCQCCSPGHWAVYHPTLPPLGCSAGALAGPAQALLLPRLATPTGHLAPAGISQQQHHMQTAHCRTSGTAAGRTIAQRNQVQHLPIALLTQLVCSTMYCH